MKNLVIQYYIDTALYSMPEFNNLKPSPVEEYSSYSFVQYCKKYDVDYIKITKPKLGFKHPTWERFDLWLDGSWWDRYDNIMYVDSDVFALPNARNVFQLYNKVGAFKSPVYAKFRYAITKDLISIVKNNPLMTDMSLKEIRKKVIQPGVFILDKLSAEKMLPFIEKYKDITDPCIDDGMWLNDCLIRSKIEIQDMDPRWNVKNNGDKINLKDIFFWHCAGGKKHKSGTRLWKELAKIYPDVKVDTSHLIK